MTATGYRRTHSWLLHLQCQYHGIYTQQQWLYIIPWICAPSMLSSATKSDRYLYSKSPVVLVIQWITHFFHRNEDVFLSHKNLPFDYHAAIKVCWHGNHNSPGWCFTFCSATSLEILRSTLLVQCLASKITSQWKTMVLHTTECLKLKSPYSV